MTAAETFFAQKARRFSSGTFSVFDDIVVYPCRIAMGTRSVEFSNADQMRDALLRYRSRLLDKGYSHSSIETTYQQEMDNGLTYALVRISHHDATGAEFEVLNASYFLDLAQLEAPVVHTVEFLEDPFEPIAA